MTKDDVGDRALRHFDAGLYCAESVLKAVSEERGVVSELIPRIATGFCSGVARTGGTCGALSGGVLALGLLTGRSSPEETVDTCYEAVQQLVSRFERQFGSCSCAALIGCDLGTDEGRQQFRQQDLRKSCRQLTAEAARIVCELLNDHGTDRPGAA